MITRILNCCDRFFTQRHCPFSEHFADIHTLVVVVGSLKSIRICLFCFGNGTIIRETIFLLFGIHKNVIMALEKTVRQTSEMNISDSSTN